MKTIKKLHCYFLSDRPKILDRTGGRHQIAQHDFPTVRQGSVFPTLKSEIKGAL